MGQSRVVYTDKGGTIGFSGILSSSVIVHGEREFAFRCDAFVLLRYTLDAVAWIGGASVGVPE